MKSLKLNGILLLALLTVACASKTTTLDFSQGKTGTARVELPRNITALSVNNEAVTLPYLMSFPYYLSVAEGPVELRFIYSEEWGRNSDISENVKSEIMKLDFEAIAGKTYSLEFEKPQSTTEIYKADSYVKSFGAWLSDANNTVATANNSGDHVSSSLKLPDLQYGAQSGSKLTELKQLWKAADPEERKAFMNWVITPTE